MKNKFYNIFLTSEENNHSRSIRLSKRLLVFILFFGIMCFAFAIVGLLRVVNHDKLLINLNKVQSINFDLKKKLSFINSIDVDINALSFKKPVDGFVTKGINRDNLHYGIDVASIKGDEIKATLDGLVIFSGYDTLTGNTIIISHDNNIYSLYGHNDTNLVNVREFVSANNSIAKVGNSGASDGPHLHFEIWNGGNVIDPRELIDSYKENDVSIKKSRH